MAKKTLLLMILFFALLLPSFPAFGEDAIVLQTGEMSINAWHFHYSRHTFSVSNPGFAILQVTKVASDDDISGGFLFLNRRAIPLKHFFKNENLVFQKKVKLSALNYLNVFLRGTPEAAITIDIRMEDTLYPPPVVNFEADPSTITLGDAATLTWQTENSENVSIDNEIGLVDASGSIQVIPTETTTYSITAAGYGGIETSQVTITVAYLPPEVQFYLSTDTIVVGESAVLTWHSNWTESCMIEPDIGVVPLNGSMTVTPEETTSYKIITAGPGGETSAEAIITVTDPEPTLEISTSAQTIVIGETAILSWTSQNATSCIIEPSIGEVSPNGAVTVSPAETTTYTITATGSGGSISAQVSIAAECPLPLVSFSASPASILLGQTSTLTWSSSYADTLEIDQGIGGVDSAGSYEVSPDQTTSYTITATGPGGINTVQVAVEVIYPMPSVELHVDPSSILIGQSAELTWNSANAVNISIDNGIGDVEPIGSLTMSPSATTTYTITAIGVGGQLATANVTLIINTPVPNASLCVDPQNVVLGNSAELSWSTTFADTITLEPGIGRVESSGSKAVTPTQTTTYTLTATGSAGTSKESVTVNVIEPPMVTLCASANSIIQGETVTLSWSASNVDSCAIQPGIGTVSISGSIDVAPTESTTYVITASGPGGVATKNVEVVMQPIPGPPIVSFEPAEITIAQGESVTLTWTSSGAEYARIDNDVGSVLPSGSFEVAPDSTTIYSLTAIGPGGATSAQAVVNVSAPPEPQPENTFGEQYQELIPENATQRTYTEYRFAVITGAILDGDENPLEDVKVAVLHHPEYGAVKTDIEGRFSIPVEGGGLMTITCQKAGFSNVQRQIDAPWNDIVQSPPIVMLMQDSAATEVAFDGNPDTVIVHKSSTVSDQDGHRACTMVFSGDNNAYLVDEDGNDVHQLETIVARATEFTTAEAMPAELPPNSAFTYCVDLTVDGADRVRFDKPVIAYVDNFLGFDVGTAVPVGYYDRDRAVWEPSENGVVVQLLDSDEDGIVDAVDSDGDTLPDDLNGSGTFDDEVQGLTDPVSYPPNATFWRVTISHFTPWDFNWPYGPPADSIPPDIIAVAVADSSRPNESGCPMYTGSFAESRNRVHHEDIAIAGTNLALHYASNRVNGYKHVVSIPASGDGVPASLKRIVVNLKVAGRTLTQVMDPLPNQNAQFVWDGMDYLGQQIHGTASAQVEVGFVYDAFYYSSSSRFATAFGQAGDAVTAVPARKEITLWKREAVILRKGKGEIADGWSVSSHHWLSLVDTSTVFKGDGGTIGNNQAIISTVAGTGVAGYGGDGGPATEALLNFPYNVDIDAEGNLYIADRENHRIRKVDVDGIITTIAGAGSPYYSGDEGPAMNAGIVDPTGLLVDPSGNIYIGDSEGNRIRKIDSNGIITTIAGNGSPGFSGDDGLAIHAAVNNPNKMAFDRNGSLFFCDWLNYRVRKIDPSGIITTVAGCGNPNDYGDGGLAVDAGLTPRGVSVDNAGNLYISTGSRIRKVDTNGIISTILGSYPGFNGDEGEAVYNLESGPDDSLIDPYGNLIFASQHNRRIRMIDTAGIVRTIVGSGPLPLPIADYSSGDGGPATLARLSTPKGVAMDKDGNLYIADDYGHRIRKVGRSNAFSGYSILNDFIFADDNGLGYVLSSNGLHQTTIDLDTGITLYTFGYDQEENLISITDQFGNQTTIQRDGNGAPLSITSPDGLVTTLTINDDNHLTSILPPVGLGTYFEYSHNGLLTAKTEPKGNRFEHYYDDNGRLTADSDNEGGNWQYTRTTVENGDIQSDVLSAEGNLTTYLDHTDSTGKFTSTITGPAGSQSIYQKSADGLTVTQDLACGMHRETLMDTDPEFKFEIVRKITETTPAMLERVSEKTVTYQDTDEDQENDLITTTVFVNGRSFTSVQNTLTSEIVSTSPEGRTASIQYDPETLVALRSSLPGYFDRLYSYDARGRLNSVDMGTRTQTYTYDANGYVDSITNALLQTTTFDNDTLGRITAVHRPDTSSIYFDYDANGNLTMINNPSKVDHHFVYNDVNLKNEYQAPLSGDCVYSYDRDRRLVSVLYPSGKQKTNVYNNIQLIQVQTPEGVINYTYDCGTKVNSAIRGSESVNFDYDGKLITAMTLSGTLNQTVGFDYNLDFALSSLTYAGNTSDLEYDNDGLLIHSGEFDISRNEDNGLPESIADSALTLSQGFNGYGESESQSYIVGGQNLVSWTLGFDDRGLIASKTESIAGQSTSHTYGYDAMGRLLTVERDGVIVESYSYDVAGTRATGTNTLRGISSRSFAYSDEDHLLTAGSMVYSYDLDGFLTSKIDGSNTTIYNYSLLGELRSVDLPDGRAIEYDYDPLGRRISKRVDSVIVEKYLWLDKTTLLAVYDGLDNLILRFEYAGSRMPVAMTMAGQTYYLACDQVGSLRLLVDGVGNVVKRIDYDTFGNILSDSNSALSVPFGFAGGLHDRDTGLVRFGYRDYDPDTGRWTAKDPMGFAGGDTDLYGYVQNNPVNWVDPLGLDGNRLTQCIITIYGLHSRTMPHNDPITNWAKKNLRQGPFNERVNKAQRLSTGFIDLSGINNWQSSLYTSGLIVGSSDGVLLFYVAPEFYFYALSNPYTINEISIGIIDAFGGTAPQTVLGQAIALGSKAGECAGSKIK